MEQLHSSVLFASSTLSKRVSILLLLTDKRNTFLTQKWPYFEIVSFAFYLCLCIDFVRGNTLLHRATVQLFPCNKTFATTSKRNLLERCYNFPVKPSPLVKKTFLVDSSLVSLFIFPHKRSKSSDCDRSKICSTLQFPYLKRALRMSFSPNQYAFLHQSSEKKFENEQSYTARDDEQNQFISMTKHVSIGNITQISSSTDVLSHNLQHAAKRDASLRQRWKYTRTKQIATLGPSSFSAQIIEELFLSGVDIFRLNFSHGVWAEKARVVRLIREIEKKWKHPIAIMADLQGPKLRIGKFKDGKTVLEDGHTFRLDMEEAPGDSTRVQFKHPEILRSFNIGDIVLIDDGKLRLVVSDVQKNFVDCFVALGGNISDYKGINIPTDVMPISALSKKDKKDALFAKSLGVDFIALSFVQKPEDVRELRDLVGADVVVIAKIEKPSAVTCIEKILSVSDGAMIARGDLGVEMNPEEVPVVQKRLINICRRMGKPVIVATQMLASMESNLNPTRAEASDVATAIYDGADAVMLSGETAAGQYPVESVKMQRRIIESVEKDPYYWKLHDVSIVEGDDTAMDAISSVAKNVAKIVSAKAIVSFSVRGDTVSKISASRPHAPLMAITPTIGIARKLQLFWGVYPVVTAAMKKQAIEALFKKGCELAMEEGIVDSENDYVVITAGLPLGTAGATNLLHVSKVALGK